MYIYVYRYIHYIIIYIYHCILKQDYSCSPQHLTGVQNASGRRCKNPRTRLAPLLALQAAKRCYNSCVWTSPNFLLAATRGLCRCWADVEPFFTPFSLYRISGSCQKQRCKHCGPARTSADQRKDGPAQDQALTQSTRPERLCQWSEVECCWCLHRWFQSWHLCSTSQPRTYGALWREGWISSLFVFISGLTKNNLYTNFINLKT